MTDTFPDGVDFGGLRSSQEIKVLVCYILKGVEQPMERAQMLELISGNGMANFFDTADAIEDLIRRGLILCDDADRLTPADGGLQIADSLYSMIPYTLREKSVSLALEAQTLQRRKRENRVEMQQNEKGYAVTCVVGDEIPPLMSFTVQVADAAQAQLVKDRFLSEPTLLYRTLISILLDKGEIL